MKLSDVLIENWGAGASSLVSPSAFTGQQVVQPITRQAADINQTHFNKKLADKKSPKKIDVSNYNDNETSDIDIYYRDDKKTERFDDAFEKLLRKMKKVREIKGLESAALTSWAYDEIDKS